MIVVFRFKNGFISGFYTPPPGPLLSTPYSMDPDAFLLAGNLNQMTVSSGNGTVAAGLGRGRGAGLFQ